MTKKSVLSRDEAKIFLKKIGEEGEEILGSAKLSWDGSSVLLRLPKGIADYFQINKNNVKTKKIKFFIKEEKENGQLKIITQFEIANRENGKRKEKS